MKSSKIYRGTKNGFCVHALLGLLFFGASSGFGAEKQKFLVTVLVDAAPPPVSADGFVDGSDAWLKDSVADLKKAVDRKEFTPNKSCPGSRAKYIVVDDPREADIALTVAARGTSYASLGQRTTLQIYNGVVLADTVPTVGE